MKLAGITLNEFLKVGLLASLFIILLKFFAARVPLPTGVQTAVGTI